MKGGGDMAEGGAELPGAGASIGLKLACNQRETEKKKKK